MISGSDDKCPTCNGSSTMEVDTGGFTPWGEPISDYVPCPECEVGE